ncbi:hypothetical protein CYMTET_33095 [Cymbomonas tetramitiformis]|uniref:Secreted protein n=1 Tax=Cymbomonas tetramitiformis TaxID=36881 RepID=A0AAE0FDZ5_9CHLO|nr:hypothetical protein CYMTET_33095 [Cymbomonas tetramitiformis]
MLRIRFVIILIIITTNFTNGTSGPAAADPPAAAAPTAAAAAAGAGRSMEHTHLEQQELLQSEVAVADDAVQHQLALLAATQQPSLLDPRVHPAPSTRLEPNNHLTGQRPAQQRVT